MPWDHVDLAALQAGMAGNNTAWQQLCDNHDELYAIYAPPILDQQIDSATEIDTDTPSGYRTRWRFRMRDNADLLDVRVRVRVQVSGGATVGVQLDVGGTTAATTTTSASPTWVSVDVTPSAANQDCKIETDITAGAGTATITGVQAYLVPAAAAAGTLASGFIRAGGLLDTSGDPISTEHVQRLLNGPRHIAADRPLSVFSSVVDEQVTPKAGGGWMAQNTTDDKLVGAGMIVPSDTVSRSYTVDTYTTQTGSGAAWRLRVGTQVIDISSTAGWDSNVIEIPPFLTLVQATITPGSSNTAVLRTVQITRREEDS